MKKFNDVWSSLSPDETAILSEYIWSQRKQAREESDYIIKRLTEEVEELEKRINTVNTSDRCIIWDTWYKDPAENMYAMFLPPSPKNGLCTMVHLTIAKADRNIQVTINETEAFKKDIIDYIDCALKYTSKEKDKELRQLYKLIQQ